MQKITLALLLNMLPLLLLSLANAQDLTYTFYEDKLTGPETISLNGFQNLTFINRSDSELDVTVTKLHDNATLDELAAADKALNASFSGEGNAGEAMGTYIGLADVIGGVHPSPGTTQSAYLRLKPGSYVIIAATGGGGDPYKADYHEVTVTEGESAEAPAADFTLHMMDFHFDFPETMKAGEQLWEVGNTGSQPHFALIFKLNEGKTAEDVLAWMMDNNAGEPPVSFDGGAIIQGVTAGQTFYTPVNLSPGTYAAVCPLPNLASGAPHFVDGMVDTFTVE